MSAFVDGAALLRSRPTTRRLTYREPCGLLRGITPPCGLASTPATLRVAWHACIRVATCRIKTLVHRTPAASLRFYGFGMILRPFLLRDVRCQRLPSPFGRRNAARRMTFLAVLVGVSRSGLGTQSSNGAYAARAADTATEPFLAGRTLSLPFTFHVRDQVLCGGRHHPFPSRATVSPAVARWSGSTRSPHDHFTFRAGRNRTTHPSTRAGSACLD